MHDSLFIYSILKRVLLTYIPRANISEPFFKTFLRKNEKITYIFFYSFSIFNKNISKNEWLIYILKIYILFEILDYVMHDIRLTENVLYLK